jgi:hypothetical protein
MSLVTAVSLIFMVFVFMLVWTEDPPPLVNANDINDAYESNRYRGDERNWTDYTLEKNGLNIRIV